MKNGESQSSSGRELVRYAAEAAPPPAAFEEAAETSSVAAAAQARASVESRYIMALRQPRNLDTCRLALLKSARRPAFAATAIWSKPTGGKTLSGPSIRFAEEALRCFRNVLVETPVVFDGEERRTVRVICTDLEANLSYALDVTLTKHVERRSAQGRRVVSERPNSDGVVVYLVEATEDELLVKQGAQVSKAIRTLGLRLLPADIVEEALALVRATQKEEDKSDPDAAKKRILDAFFDLGVGPAEVERFTGRPVVQLLPSDVHRLRLAYTALKDGEATWAELVAAALEERGQPAEAAAGKGSAALRERLDRKRAGTTATAPAGAPPPEPMEHSASGSQASSD